MAGIIHLDIAIVMVFQICRAVEEFIESTVDGCLLGGCISTELIQKYWNIYIHIYMEVHHIHLKSDEY